MAVSRNPYIEWSQSRQKADYRCTDSQLVSLVRQQLSEDRYLRSSNRVNPGPYRNKRVKNAENSATTPHCLANEDLWGWQRWADSKYLLQETELATELLEQYNAGPSLCSHGNILLELQESPQDEITIISQKSRIFEFTQQNPLQTWFIKHDLGFYPSVELFNNYRREIDADVIHINNNQLRVEFSIPTSGFARLN